MIHFVGNVQSQFARGKDKTKRKSRVNPLVGAGLGTAFGGPGGTIAGALIAKGVNKERDRFDKEGARSHLGKVGHDASLGAKSLGIGSAVMGGLIGSSLGSNLPVRKKGFLGLGRDKKQEAKDRIKNTLMGAGLGVLGGGVAGAINGVGTGAVVGASRGFVQENRMGKKKKSNFNEYINAAEFAYNLPSYFQPKKKSRVGLKTGLITGALGGGVTGAIGSGISGAIVDRQIDKEKDRFRKKGARSRLGKIGNDTKIGAKTIGGMSVLKGVIASVRANPGSFKQKLAGAITSGVSSGALGSIGGGLIGSGVGLVRGFRQPNKKKK